MSNQHEESSQFDRQFSQRKRKKLNEQQEEKEEENFTGNSQALATTQNPESQRQGMVSSSVTPNSIQEGPSVMSYKKSQARISFREGRMILSSDSSKGRPNIRKNSNN